MLRCRVFGHRPRFWTDGAVMRWSCERDCGAGGEKTYPTVEQARRYASAFDRDERRDLGRRAPLGLFPLRLVHLLRTRRR
jgi:hypothetical protein